MLPSPVENLQELISLSKIGKPLTMYCNVQAFKEKMDSGQVCLGAGITFTDITVTECVAPNMDFLWIDLEHNPITMETMTKHIIAGRATNTMSIVRIPSDEPAWIKRALDSGAEGIILPQAKSYEEVADYVSLCRYPPVGTRGFGPRRPTDYGRFRGQEYLDTANEKLFVVAQIESAGAMEDLDKIVAIEELDSLVLGPADLSGSLGHMMQTDHPVVEGAINEVISKGRANGKYIGMGLGADADFAVKWATAGVHWLQAGNDFEYMNRFSSNLVSEIHSRLSE